MPVQCHGVTARLQQRDAISFHPLCNLIYHEFLLCRHCYLREHILPSHPGPPASIHLPARVRYGHFHHSRTAIWIAPTSDTPKFDASAIARFRAYRPYMCTSKLYALLSPCTQDMLPAMTCANTCKSSFFLPTSLLSLLFNLFNLASFTNHTLSIRPRETCLATFTSFPDGLPILCWIHAVYYLGYCVSS